MIKRFSQNLDERTKQSMLLVFIGVIASIALAVIKLHVGLSSNSITILLDATNSFLDVVTYLITFIAIIVAVLPKKNYGRAEYLASFVVSVVAVVFGGLFFFRSLNRLAMPEPIWFGWQNLIMLAVTIPVKLLLAFFFRSFGKRHSSSALTAISLDCFLDVFITATSLVSFAVSGSVDYAVDAIVGIVLSVLVVVIGVKMVASNVKLIVKGRDFSGEKIQILMACKQKGLTVKDVVFHDYGVSTGVCTVTVEFDGDMDEFFVISQALCDDLSARTALAVSVLPVPKQD